MRMYHTNGAEVRIPYGGGRMRKKKQKLWIPVAIGFSVLYLVTMGLSTWMVEQKFEEDYRNYYLKRLENMSFVYQETVNEGGEPAGREERLKRCGTMLSSVPLMQGDDKNIQLSAAVYDENGQFLMEWKNMAFSFPVETSNIPYRDYEAFYFDLSDYLTEEELQQIAKYSWDSLEKQLKDTWLPNEYRFIARVDPDTMELCGILIQKLTWEKNVAGKPDPLLHQVFGYNDYSQTKSEVVWEWKNPACSEEKLYSCKLEELSIAFPGLVCGYDEWLQWEQNAYLHNFEKKLAMDDENAQIDYRSVFYHSDEQGRLIANPFRSKVRSSIPLYLDAHYSGEHWNLVLAMDSHPWLAAVDYMKYLYLMGFVLMLVCMGKIIYVTDKAYKQRVSMEEMRRDFTNAIAHELKTPLGIIRGFAENLMEHNAEEKRDYYLMQIIGQTEEMDHLVAEMIAVSKMDSEEMVLQKESVVMSELFKEQAAKLEPVIREKNLHVQYDCGKDFVIEGDREYLTKAVWNLISNAVTYNIPDGSILIRTEPEGCSIENTGFPLTEEQLSHAFDMFYGAGKSRVSEDKHMGLGLFLVKKICGLHGLSISLENTDSGVKAAIIRISGR